MKTHYRIENDKAVVSDSETELFTTDFDGDVQAAIADKEKFFGPPPEDDGNPILLKDCYCNAGIGGCKSTKSRWCNRHSEAECIRALAAECERG